MSLTGGIRALKQRRACFWALRGYPNPENRDHRRKLRSIMKPKHRCLVNTSDRNQVCTRHGSQLAISFFTWLQPHRDSSDSADNVVTSPNRHLVRFKKYHIHCHSNYLREVWSCKKAIPEVYLICRIVFPSWQPCINNLLAMNQGKLRLKYKLNTFYN